MTKTTTVAKAPLTKKFWRLGSYSWIINIGAEHQHTHFACIKFVNGKFDCLVIHKNVVTGNCNNFHLDCIISGKSLRDAVTDYMSRYLSYHEIMHAVYRKEITL